MYFFDKRWTLFLASMAKLGMLTRAPGTLASFVSLPICALFLFLPFEFQAVLLLFLILSGVMVCDIAAAELGEKDPSSIVLDEFLGLLTALVFFPLSLALLLYAFFIFRFFDIVKPWPVSYFDQKIDGGAAIVLDDIAAGLYTKFFLYLLVFFKLI